MIVASSYCGSNVAPAISCSAPACNYSYTAINIQYGTCSATACGTSGTRAVASFQCQRNDGTIVANSYCASPAAQSCSAAACATCPAGSADYPSAANNVGITNTCSFSWNQASSGQSSVVTRSTNGGTLTAVCGASGQWTNVIANCPKPSDNQCPSDRVLYTDSSGKKMCGKCIPARVAGDYQSGINVEGVAINGSCYYPGLSIALIDSGRCSRSLAFGGWFAGPPNLQNGWFNQYPTSGNNLNFSRCYWKLGSTLQTYFLNCEAPAMGGACSGDGSGGSTGAGTSGGGMSASPL